MLQYTHWTVPEFGPLANPGLPCTLLMVQVSYEGSDGPYETHPGSNCEANGGILSGGFIPTLGGQKCFLTDQDNFVKRKSAPISMQPLRHEMDNGVTVRGEYG